MPSNRVSHQVVADRYELLESVGRGGFGVVWRACDTLLQRHVAVKEIHIPGFLNDADRADLRDKVLKEARAAARLDHPGAVTVFDVIDDDDHPVIVMELVEAPNLSELVAERGPLPPADAARIGLEVLDVLVAAHARGIVHRDVKPGNVMVGESGRVRLGDFGVAAILDDPTVSTSGAITGSPAYMAPEQATNKGAVPESDLWSLGATLYFAVEGRPPFDKGAPLPTLTSIVRDPPRPAERAGALGPVLDQLLVKDPQSRLSETDLRKRLAEVAEGRIPEAAAAPTARVHDTVVIDIDGPVAWGDDPEPTQAAPAPPPTPPQPEPRPRLQPPPPQPQPRARPQPQPAVVARAPAGAHRGRGMGWVAGVVAILVVALIAVALTARNGDHPGTATSPSPSTTASPSGSGSENRGTSTASGRVTYTDPQTGFTIARPSTWTVRTNGSLTDFRDPATGAYLRVDYIEPPGPSPEGAWFELEKTFAAENDNYRRIRIEPTTYSGYRAAIWEFTYSDGGADLHVVDLGFVTPRYGFALYFQTKVGDWDRMQSTFQAFKDSFKAPA